MSNYQKMVDRLWGRDPESLAPKAQGVDDAYIQQFTADANAYSDTIGDIIKGVQYGTAGQIYQEQSVKGKELRDRADRALAYIDMNRELYDPETYRSFRAQIEDFRKSVAQNTRTLKDAVRHYSQWDTEDAYNAAVQRSGWAQKYQGKGYQELVPLLDALEDGEEKQWLTDYAGAARYQEQMGMDLDAGVQEIRGLEDQLKNARTLELEYNSFRENPLLMLTQGDTWRDLESRYDALQEQGGIQGLTDALTRKRQYLAEANALQRSVQEEADWQKWTETVRDAATIRKEIEGLDRLLAENEKQIRRANQGSTQQDLQKRQEVTGSTQVLKQKKAQLEQELQYRQMADYAALMDREDFARYSGYIPTGEGNAIRDNATGMFVDTGFGDIEYDYINKNEKAAAYQTTIDSLSNLSRMGMDRKWLLQMTEDEVAVYNYLYRKEGKEAASKYLDVMRSTLNQRQRAAEETQWAETAAKHPVLASGASVLISPLRAGSFVGQAIDYAADGKIDQNAAYNRASYISTAIRNQVTQQIQRSGKWGSVGSFAYQTGMSMADFLLAAGISGGTAGVATAILGSGAAADTVIQGKDRGLQDNEAFMLGSVAGLAEAMTERFSMDALFDVDMLKSGIGKYVLVNSLTEGSEEAASGIINLFADILITKEKSEWQKAIRSYQDQGYSEGEAFGKAMADQAAAIGLDTLGGMLSGGLLSGGTAVQYSASTSKTGRAMGRRGLTDPQQVQQILDAGANAKEGSAANVVAARLQQKMDAGQKLTAFDKGQLYQSNPQTVSEAVFGQGSVDLANDKVQGIDETHKDWDEARWLATITGKAIRFYNGNPNEDGYYIAENDVIYINVNRKKHGPEGKEKQSPVAYVFAHELTHSTELADSYRDLIGFVKGRIAAEGRDWNYMMRQTVDTYEKGGHPLDNDNAVEAEVVAKYVQDHLLRDENELHELFWEEPTIGQKILNWFDRMLAKSGKNEKAVYRVHLQKGRQMVLQAFEDADRARKQGYLPQQRQMEDESYIHAPTNAQEYRQWIDQEYEAGRFTEEEYDQILDALEHDEQSEIGSAEEGRQYSFAGKNARTADMKKLQQAKAMQAEGVDNETIRQQTGWFQGMDKKWRFEIDDSSMQYHRAGDALFSEIHPEYARHQELMQKWLYGELEGNEETEFRDLDETWGREHQRLSDRVRRGNATLQNVLRHDELFEAYPELRGAKVRFENMEPGERGRYDPSTNSIILNEQLKNAPQETLLHEIQHAIQNAEGFTGGASIEYWKEQRRDIVETIAAARKNLDLWLADIGYPEVNRQSLLAVSRREKPLAQHWKDMEEFKANSEFARQIAACEAEIAEFQKQYDAITHGMTAYEQYENTAGEIEARDTANRWKLGLDEEGRKETPPDLGDDRTVFTEGDARSFSIVDIEGEKETYGTGVLLDTNIFDGVRTREWGKVLSRFVYQNLAGSELTMYDDNGNAETVYLARETDRVRKDGAKNSHKVIEKLARYKGDNITALATIHLPELLTTSHYDNASDAHDHQWMDENGWIYRKTYIQDRAGNIYEAVLNIADGRDRKILYAINNVRKIDKRAAHGVVPSTNEGRGSHIKSNSSMDNVTDAEGKVNRQYSLQPQTVSKHDVARDLRAILSRGGDPKELQRYVDTLEGTRRTAEQNGEKHNSTAREIMRAAHSQGQSVEEYLRWNPEEFEVDGRWRPEALEAMRMEQGGRQYSLNTAEPKQTIPMKKATESAISIFGTTTDFAEAGFILPSGEMLRFTDDNHPGERIYDHRAIGMVYGVDVDLNTNHGFNYESNDFMDEFVENGGIRFDPGDMEFNMDAGMQLSRTIPLTREQEQTIRDYIEWKKQREDHYSTEDDPLSMYSGPLTMHIDFGGNADIAVSSEAKDLDAWGIKHLTYEGGQIRASRIINDIRHYYKTGETRHISDIARFRYSLNAEDENTESQAREIRRDTLPTKARNYLARAESKLLNTVGEALHVPRHARYKNLQSIIQQISDTYLAEGTIPEEKMQELFDKAYAEGIVADHAFYDQYKEIKRYLQTCGVTLREQDRSIPDFEDFRKRAFGTLRILNEGGVPVDTAYQELRTMAPELFPERITHPADQLVKMLEVGQSIAVSKKNLDEYYGNEREEFRSWARGRFDQAIGEVVRDLQDVIRYSQDQAELQEEQKKRGELLTPEEAAKEFNTKKILSREVEKVRARNLLTESDEILLGRMLKGEIGEQHLDPNHDNVKGIMAVYKAKLAYEEQCELLAAYRRSVRAKRLQEADRFLETARAWKDKRAGILYARETMRRNLLDIIPDRKLAEEMADFYFEAVHVSEARATRFKNDYRDRVRALKLSTRVAKGNLVSEAHAVQLLGEALDNIRVMEKGRMYVRDGKTLDEWRTVVNELWSNNLNLDRAKVERAVEAFRKIYDELFREMNRVRVENGYEPVSYRQGYFPHFQADGDGIMGYFGKVLGINTQVDMLPTSINGLTHTFKPGIQWFSNAQQRIGYETAYDAVAGFDRYIEGVASVIYQTENIQKLRALATQVRYRTTDEGIRKQVDAVRMDSRLSEEQKQLEINAIYEHGRFSLSNFVSELDEYTNLLANKKSRYDRTMEALIGRRAYTIMKEWENRIGANMIAGNISSALTNFIPLTQAGAQLDSGMILQGMWETLRNLRSSDGFAGMSDFLTNRRGSDPLVRTWVQKASGVLGTPMQLIDNFTSESIVRAAYLQNRKRGLSEAEAMHQADILASGVMADRSKGSMPTLFESRNPLFKAFTQFQLEVNNQFSEVFKDLPRNHREKGLAVLALVLLKYFLGAWLYNELFEKLIGRRSALDPIGILNETVGDLTGYEIPNLFDMGLDLIRGEDISFETEKVGIGEAGTNLASNILSELPFSAGLNMFGIETDGGRLPAASAVVDLSAVWDAATKEGWTGEQRWKQIQDELNKLAYVVPPFGGGQISKTWKGVKAYLEGGSYSLNQKGEEILQYPVYKDGPDDAFWSLVRAALMGKNSLPEAQDWVNDGFASLNALETATYQDMLEAGVQDRQAYAAVDALRNIVETEAGPKRAEAIRLLNSMELSYDGKAVAFYGLVASASEREWMDALADAGAAQADTMVFVTNLYDAGKLKGTEKKEAQMRAFLDTEDLTEDEKRIAVGFIMDTDLVTESGNPTQYAKFLTAMERGLTVDRYMELRAAGTDIDDYLEMTDLGIRGEKAADLVSAMDALEPADGYDEVTWIQKCNVIMESGLNEPEQMAALETVMYESTYEKVKVGHNFGMNVKSYIDLKSVMPQFDANGNGNYSQQETEDAINALAGDDNILFALTGTTPNGYTLTDREKAILWQLQNKSWNPKRNPFDREVGQMVYDYLTAEDPAEAAAKAESGEAFDIADLFAKGR